eukprot:SAG22_NODE_288_length_12949_cov_163.316265_7_plen_62_part_00
MAAAAAAWLVLLCALLAGADSLPDARPATRLGGPAGPHRPRARMRNESHSVRCACMYFLTN